MDVSGIAGSPISSIIVSAITGYAAAWIQLRAKVHEGVHTERAREYKKIWAMTCLLPKWPRAHDVSYGKLRKLSEDFKNWYFNDGGLFLSYSARRAYGKVQEQLAKVLKDKDNESRITEEDYDNLQKRLSTLRTELTRDLLSRKRFSSLLPFR